MNYIHRFAGRLLTIAANIHVIGYGTYVSFTVIGVPAEPRHSIQMDQCGELREAHLTAALCVGRRRHCVH